MLPTRRRWLPLFFAGLALLLGLKAALTLTDTLLPEQALAADTPAPQDAATNKEDHSAATPPEKAASPAKVQDVGDAAAKTVAKPDEPVNITEFSGTELKLLQSLRERREELAIREEAVLAKEKLLQGMEQRVQNKIDELNAIKSQIEQVRGELINLSSKFRQNENKQVAALIKVYEKMKPQNAADIFNKLEMPVLLDVVRGMNDSKLAPILAAMSPEKATKVTEILGQRTLLPDLATSAADSAQAKPSNITAMPAKMPDTAEAEMMEPPPASQATPPASANAANPAPLQ